MEMAPKNKPIKKVIKMNDEFNLDEIIEETIDKPEEEFQTTEYEKTDYAKNLLDVQIIVKNLKSAELIIKALDGMNLKENYNLNISSIIPSTDIEFIKKSVKDADLILITTELTNTGKEEFINYYKELKTDYNYVEYLIFTNNIGDDFTEPSQIEEEIQKSIIRAALTSILSNADINKVQKELFYFKQDYNKLNENNEQLNLENESLISQAHKITEENIELKNEIHKLNREIDNIKSEYSDFKARFSNIHSKNLFEIFNLKQLWEETFNETFNQYENVLKATNNFNPENIIIGQNYIGAKTKEEAIEWLKIIKTSLVFLSDNPNLKQEINNNSSTTHEENSNTFTNLWE